MVTRFIFFALLTLSLSTGAAYAQPRQRSEQKVVFVMLDGMRWQDVFRGADPALAASAEYMGSPWARSARQRFVDVADKRAALMPFLTQTVRTQGALIGDRDHASCARVTNNMWFSYPGYNEALTGVPDPRIQSNQYGPNPNVTWLEWLNARPDFRGKVRAVTSWDAFPRIINAERSGVPVDAGFAPIETRDPALAMANRLLADTAQPFDEIRLDAYTHQFALAALRSHVRALFISYGETDDFAHAGDYAQYLISAHRTDRFLRELWEALQADRFYAGRTTMLVTVDHGRGDQPGESWKHHYSPDGLVATGSSLRERFPNGVPGSDQTWMAAIGPRIRAGASTGAAPGTCAGLNQIAATALTALDLDWRAYNASAGAPLDIFAAP